MCSGRIRKRAGLVENTVARICRDAGARVTENTRLTCLNLSVLSSDRMEMEVAANCLLCCGEQQLAIDATVRSLLAQNGRGPGALGPTVLWPRKLEVEHLVVTSGVDQREIPSPRHSSFAAAGREMNSSNTLCVCYGTSPRV